MTSPKASASAHSTDVFDFIYGRFELSGDWRIPYLSTVMTFRQAEESLDLVTEFPGWEDLLRRLEELFQRDIDWPRVERKIVPYLNAAESPRFFNALTVALLPRTGSNLIEWEDWESHTWHPPSISKEEASGKTLSVGPVSVGYYHNWEDPTQLEAKLGKVRWNKEQMFCVAIDGQHRLAAIKEIASTSPDLATADIPVLLVIPNEELGFRSPRNGTRDITVLRRLFIDLNKHAKPVSRMRLILLDDADPTSLCTRATIGEELTDGVAELTADEPRLPLTLVDWHTDSAKVDSGPYVVSVLTLDWAVQKILESSAVSDPMQHSSVRNQIRSLQKALGVDLLEAEERLEQCEKAERPFLYSDQDPDELTLISQAFKRVWTPSLTCLFSTLPPYERLINRREANSSNTVDFVTWYQLHVRKEKDKHGGHATAEYNRLINRWRDSSRHYESDLERMLSEAQTAKLVPSGTETSLAFAVVFQKALIHALKDFLKLDGLFVEDTAEKLGILGEAGDAESDQEALSRQYLRSTRLFTRLVNDVLDARPTLLGPHFEEDGVPIWAGTLLSADRSTIDFAEAAAIRGQDVLLLAVYLRFLHLRGEVHSVADIKAHVTEGGGSSNDPRSRLRVAANSFMSGTRTNAGRGAAERILRAQDIEEPDADQKYNVFEDRVRLFWSWVTGI